MKLLIAFYLFLFSFTSTVSAADHPLRPFPEETPKDKISQEFLTPYCASRPTAVQSNRFDRRHQTFTLEVYGDLTSDFTSFVTPLLSITDQNKADYNLPDNQKAQRYMADYLEGRAYYEPFAELIGDPAFLEKLQQNTQLTSNELNQIQAGNPAPETQAKIDSSFMMSRYGVFRKLAPQTYQDKLKRLLIQRSKQNTYASLNQLEKVYGFRPASIYVNPDTPVQNLKLVDFYLNWAPLPEDFTTFEKYKLAYSTWELKDGGKWAKLWPYVPMFTREDSKGLIITHDEPYQTSTPQTAVFHPHLARTYEVSSTLSNMLSPQGRHTTPQDPKLSSDWITPAPWTTSTFWIESGQSVPSDYGSVCDPKNTVVSSSGDLALDKSLLTDVDSRRFKGTSQEDLVIVPNPEFPLPIVSDNCGDHWSCESCVEGYDQITQQPTFFLDDTGCFFDQNVRFSPTYLETKTPYLAQIMERLSTGPAALFNIFRTTQEIANDPPENWPGLGYEDEENPIYSFSNGPAEAGLKNDGDQAKYYYKYLGYLQCQKEKILARLLPAGHYQSFAPECGLGFTPPPTEFNGQCTGEAFSKLNPPTETTDIAHDYFQSTILPLLTDEVTSVYAEVEKQTGVPCEVLAGIHFIEGGNNPNQSLVSGRAIGSPEPDAGNRVFTSLFETAMYAADHLKAKVGGDISDLNTLITALSRYNGGGNSNCNPNYSCSSAKKATTSFCPVGSACCDLACRENCALENSKTVYDFVYSYGTPPFCPPAFEGIDDLYPANWYDQDHLEMYLLYCGDRTMCTPQLYQRPGVLTVAVEYYLTHQND
jgi:hypothetical protein